MSDPSPFIYRASSVEELALPLQAAFSEAAKAAQPATFRLKLAPGTYSGFALTLEDLHNRHSKLILIVERDEDADGDGPVVLDGGALKLGAGRVLMRDVVLTGVRSEGPALTVRVAHQCLFQGVALVGNTRTDARGDDPLVHLTVGYGSRAAQVVWRDCWCVNNTVEGAGALIATPKIGRGVVESFTFERVAFARNVADASLTPWFTRAVNMIDCAAYENRNRHALLDLKSPITQITLRGGAIATARPLARLHPSIDASIDDFPPVVAEDITLHLGRPQTPPQSLEPRGDSRIVHALPRLRGLTVDDDARALAPIAPFTQLITHA